MAEKLGASVTVTRKVFVKTVEQRDVDNARSKLAEHLVARARGKAKNGRGKHLKDVPDSADYEIDPADEEKFHIPKLGAKLWVAEALIKPYDGTNGSTAAFNENGGVHIIEANPTQQLRISLTGPTTCGKSTLLGTLTTGDLDNGRGKSRLSLLRHRHELVSGVTSSVAWEIIGYKPEASPQSIDEADDCGFFGTGEPEEEAEEPTARVVNYATGNISSWTDIHSAAEGGRIVFMSDSAGQLKYRRTTVRSLVGWAPHYAALLIPANDTETEDGPAGLSEASRVHMELCIKLGLPLIVVFTKMDIASKPGLRAVLIGVLSILKASGKKPLMLQNSGKIKETCMAIAAEPEAAVPIVFTSSVKGDGINLVHDLLMNLPMPALPVSPSAVHPLPHTSITGVENGIDDIEIVGSGGDIEIRCLDSDAEDDSDDQLTTLFHVEEVYGMKPSGIEANSGGSVISGHVRYGKVSIGDKLTVGPFYAGSDIGHRSRSATPTPTNGTPLLSVSAASYRGMLSRSPESGDESPGQRSPHRERNCYEEEAEWRLVRVVSVRRLRLPVTTLFAGEAGTIGIVPIDEENEDETPPPAPTSGSQPIDIRRPKAVSFELDPPEELRLKKGLVIVNRGGWMKAYTGFSAITRDPNAARGLVVGADVIIYVASVRTVARIVTVEPAVKDEGTRFVCEFLGVEWVELGAKVLVMKNRPMGGGMEVFVGKVEGRLRVLGG
ncbi:hypothetical protein FN846DRAFT_933600 [Sphaerosporella brunnea]|uniref:Tr-type G domain-containing protein n=1 Tax=Sphaerosporella brunnea TaxID=1250544 RepID=A0A5J5F712_9PEZI|nr:hypothetical protein FN846DRAFT_933600 [Sphaerosporella brunnea]